MLGGTGSNRMVPLNPPSPSPYWRTEVLDWLREKFGDRVISYKMTHPWPAKSSDLSPLDYWFWSVCMAAVRKGLPATLDELKLIVEVYANSLTPEMINKSVNHIFVRAKACLEQNGASFERHLKKKKGSMDGDN